MYPEAREAKRPRRVRSQGRMEGEATESEGKEPALWNVNPIQSMLEAVL